MTLDHIGMLLRVLMLTFEASEVSKRPFVVRESTRLLCVGGTLCPSNKIANRHLGRGNDHDITIKSYERGIYYRLQLSRCEFCINHSGWVSVVSGHLSTKIQNLPVFSMYQPYQTLLHTRFSHIYRFKKPMHWPDTLHIWPIVGACRSLSPLLFDFFLGEGVSTVIAIVCYWLEIILSVCDWCFIEDLLELGGFGWYAYQPLRRKTLLVVHDHPSSPESKEWPPEQLFRFGLMA